MASGRRRAGWLALAGRNGRSGMGLDGKVAWITGGGTGIGAVINTAKV